MRKIRIVSDSSSDIQALEYADFASAPMKVITDGAEFVDDPSLDVDGMADYFDRYKGRSQTSCPNVSDWLECFGDAEDVICVTITGALSGSYNSACSAKRIYESEHEGRRVFVMDTLSAGPEITLVVRRLEEYVREGRDFEEICEGITEYVKGTGLVFMLKSLKNFANNGRVSPIVARIVGIAGICIVGRASDEGTLEPTHKCRGEARSLETLIDGLRRLGLRSGRVSIGHCQNESGAERLRSMIENNFEAVQTEVHKLRGLCSFYAEKGGILIGFEKA
jgi:DegV family protein with EDD domain